MTKIWQRVHFITIHCEYEGKGTGKDKKKHRMTLNSNTKKIFPFSSSPINLNFLFRGPRFGKFNTLGIRYLMLKYFNNLNVRLFVIYFYDLIYSNRDTIYMQRCNPIIIPLTPRQLSSVDFKRFSNIFFLLPCNCTYLVNALLWLLPFPDDCRY